MITTDRGDQVGVPNGGFPWRRPGWARDRLREMGYTALSWPYAFALALTVFFFVQTDALTLQAMLAGWTLAFARREFAAWMAARNIAAISRTETGRS